MMIMIIVILVIYAILNRVLYNQYSDSIIIQ